MLHFLKKNSLVWFCIFLCLDDLRGCFRLNKHKPWLELFFKFNQYNMRPLEHWWGLIIFKLTEVLESLLSIYV